MAAKTEKFKIEFLGNPGTHRRKISQDRIPGKDLQYAMVTDSPAKLRAALEVTLKKSPTFGFGFRGSEFFSTLVAHDVAYKNGRADTKRGSNSRLAGGVLPRNP